MHDLSHLESIRIRLSHERHRVETCKPRERAWREHNVRMIEREEASELAFLAKRGVTVPADPVETMTDDELLDALMA